MQTIFTPRKLYYYIQQFVNVYQYVSTLIVDQSTFGQFERLLRKRTGGMCVTYDKKAEINITPFP